MNHLHLQQEKGQMDKKTYFLVFSQSKKMHKADKYAVTILVVKTSNIENESATNRIPYGGPIHQNLDVKFLLSEFDLKYIN